MRPVASAPETRAGLPERAESLRRELARGSLDALRLVGILVRRLGEPLRSAFTEDAMRALLAKYRFGVVRDHDLPALAATLSPDLAKATRVMKHARIAIADIVP